MAACMPWETTESQAGKIHAPEQQQQQQQHALTASEALEAAFSQAEASVANVCAGLHGVHASQMDVSARLSGSKARCTGRKRKLSLDCSDAPSGFATGPTKADTPTQELLPASRSELRSHQLAAVRWLASLERHGGGGVLADEAEADRRAEVTGLLSHLASTPPEAPHPYLQPLLREQPPGSSNGAAPSAPANVCLLLAPSSTLGRWAEAISAHVDGRLHRLHRHDGSQASAAALRAVCSGNGYQATMAHNAATNGPLDRRSACGGAYPASGACASGGGGGNTLPPPMPGHLRLPLQLLAQPNTSHYPVRSFSAHPAPPGSASPLLVVLAPLEQLHRDAELLAQLPTRLLVADVAARGGAGGRRGGGDRLRFGLGPEFGADELGPGGGDGADGGGGDAADGGGGLDMGEAGQHLHLLGRLPAACRILLSAGDPAPSAGDGIWLVMQLLAPSLQRPLWEAVGSLQQVLTTSGGVGAQCQEGVMAAVHARLWALLRPLVLHRRARDVELGALRATATSLNLYDHFSAARGEHAAELC